MTSRWLRECAEVLLGAGAAAWRVRNRAPSDRLVLAFHNVIPDRSPAIGDQSLHLPLSSFRSLIDRLTDLCSPVRLGEPTATGARPTFAVTFDDAYRGAVTLALPRASETGRPRDGVRADFACRRSRLLVGCAGECGGWARARPSPTCPRAPTRRRPPRSCLGRSAGPEISAHAFRVAVRISRGVEVRSAPFRGGIRSTFGCSPSARPLRIG